MVKITGTQSNPIINNEAFSVENRIPVFEDPHPFLQQIGIVKVAQSSEQPHVGAGRNQNFHIHSALGGFAQCSDGFPGGDKVGSGEPDALGRLFKSFGQISLIKVLTDECMIHP